MIGMQLSGDENVPAMPLAESEVNHLRRLLAWMRCEYMLDENMQRGFLGAVKDTLDHYPHQAGVVADIMERQVEQITKVPAYVRQGHKMLTRALREHEARSGVSDGNAARQHSGAPSESQWAPTEPERQLLREAHKQLNHPAAPAHPKGDPDERR